MDLSQKLATVPDNPGVYFMLDKDDKIIYIGKAKNLKKRLSQYFLNSKNKSNKVLAMLFYVKDFKYIICQSEVDALVLENNLIKKHKPHYNILLKDDKSYPYIKIDMKDKYPRVQFVRKLEMDGAKYFGPYMQSVNIRDIFDLIHTAFKIRECRRDLGKKSKPCLNFHLDKCLAPCTGTVSSEEYKREIAKVVDFLRGNDSDIRVLLEEKMKMFAESENFEVALRYRDKIKVLDKIVRKQISAIPKDVDLDIVATADNGIYCGVSIIFVRAGKMVGMDKFIKEYVDMDMPSLLFQYYQLKAPLCHEIVTNIKDTDGIFESAISHLAGRKIKLTTPSKGTKRQLLDTALTNVCDMIDNSFDQEKRKEMKTRGAVQSLFDSLSLSNLPRRIEAYDISHISGTDKVASMVVFEDGEPKTKHYRKFKIKTVDGNNDFECMKEVLRRRLHDLTSEDESFGSTPDLILIDGGKGQLSSVLDITREFNVQNIDIISLAKQEEIVFSKTNPTKPICLKKTDFGLQLLQRVRDEAHRFAITFHRSLRQKKLVESQLQTIEKIGKKKSADLLKQFGSVENVKRAKIDDIAKVKGFSVESATKLHEELNKDSE